MRKVPRPYTDPAPLFRHGGVISTDRGPVLDFSVNVNPLGPPQSVLQAIRRELPAIAHYPDPACRRLTERLAREHGVEPEQVVVGNGSNELIYAIARAFRPRRVAIVEPTYTEYLRASLLVGAEVDHWLPEFPNFLLSRFDPEGADLVWLCNPNNPTGQKWPPAWMLREWMGQQSRSLFVMDEAFLPFWADATERSLVSQLDKLSNLIVLRSMTKFYSLPGLRLGYAVTTPEQGRRLRERLAPWSVNALAQVAGLAALDDAAFREQTQSWFQRHASRFQYDLAALESVPARFRLIGSSANFVLLELHDRSAEQLTGDLLERGIAVRDASNFVGLDSRYVRVAISTPGNNRKLLEALAAVL